MWLRRAEIYAALALTLYSRMNAAFAVAMMQCSVKPPAMMTVSTPHAWSSSSRCGLL